MTRARNAGRAEPMDWIMDIDRPYGTEDIVASAIAPLFENPREPRVCHSTVG